MAEVIQGLRELQRSLHAMALDMERKAARRAVSAGAKIVKAAVAEHAARQPTLADAPFEVDGVLYQPGHIARNVISKNLQESTGRLHEAVVAVRSNRANGYAGRIASFNEFGTVKMAPQPFMRPGFEASKGEALNAITESLRRAVEAKR